MGVGVRVGFEFYSPGCLYQTIKVKGVVILSVAAGSAL